MAETKVKNNKDKSNVLRIVIIVMLLLIIIGGTGFGTWYFVKSKNSTADTSEKQEVKETMFSLDEFLVNLADEKGRRYLKAKIYIGHEENEELALELEEKKTILRDATISVLRTKKSEDLDAYGAEQLKTELLMRLNSHLTKGKARNIYFYDILVQ
jgi:flagellar basal body-associated protein FliL